MEVLRLKGLSKNLNLIIIIIVLGGVSAGNYGKEVAGDNMDLEDSLFSTAPQYVAFDIQCENSVYHAVMEKNYICDLSEQLESEVSSYKRTNFLGRIKVDKEKLKHLNKYVWIVDEDESFYKVRNMSVDDMQKKIFDNRGVVRDEYESLATIYNLCTKGFVVYRDCESGAICRED